MAQARLIERCQLADSQLWCLAAGSTPRLANFIDQRLVTLDRDVPGLAACQRFRNESPRLVAPCDRKLVDGFELAAQVEAEIFHAAFESQWRALALRLEDELGRARPGITTHQV